MTTDAFSDVTTWVFDLDNTLYPPAVRLFDQIEIRMTQYVMDAIGVDRPEADRLRKQYWAQYGTTLAGLMREHDVDPGPYLTDVHDIDFTVLSKDPVLADRIAALPGRKIVYTNGCAPYARNVLRARGIEHLMDAVYGVEDADFLPKPEAGAFRTVFAKDGFEVARAAMFEDDARNLKVPFDLGMRTIHVADTPGDDPFIQFKTHDLSAFLGTLA